MNKNIKIIIGILIVFTIIGCPEELFESDETIKLVNNSNEDIVWHHISHELTSDTSQLIESFPWGNDVEYRKIEKGTSYSYEIYSGSIKDLLNDGWWQFYFLNYDSVTTIPWERIRDENIILKKVYFETWEDLEACNFTITYP